MSLLRIPIENEACTDNGAMALRCCVSLACVCDLHYSSSKDISFHRFPVDQVAGREWIFKSRRGIVNVLQVSLMLTAA